MPLHIIKLCVGTSSIEELKDWQTQRLADQKAAGFAKPQIFHRTGMRPKRSDEVLGGGSLYWVIKGLVSVRQRIVGLGEGQKDDGTPCCLLLLDRKLVPVRPTPRRAFQGWRYLEASEAPPDLTGAAASGFAALPATMRKELASLGLL